MTVHIIGFFSYLHDEFFMQAKKHYKKKIRDKKGGWLTLK